MTRFYDSSANWLAACLLACCTFVWPASSEGATISVRVADGSWEDDVLQATVESSETASLEVRITNTSGEAKSILTRESSRTEGFIAAYSYGAEDVTSDVQGGGWDTGELADGDSVYLVLRLSSPDGAPGDVGCVSLEGSYGVDPEVVVPEPDDTTGLIGGHIDVDTCATIATVNSGDTDGHVHEYDNKYDVDHVDYFHILDDKLHNITDDVPDGSTRFKLIVANADLSRSGRLVINEGSGAVPVTLYDDTPIADLPVYSFDGVPGTTKLEALRMEFSLEAVARGLLIPTNTGDVKKNVPGKNGEWRNGALTIQAVKVNADGSDGFTIDATKSSGGHGVAASGLLWESTIFWHWKGPSYHDEDWDTYDPYEESKKKGKKGDDDDDDDDGDDDDDDDLCISAPMALWAVNETHPKLYCYRIAGNAVLEAIEGELDGFSGNPDVEALTISDGGVIYLMDNRLTSKLYRIMPEELDGDPTTPVTVTFVGNTGLSAGSSNNEINGLQFVEGVLYGVGKKSKIIYRVDVGDGHVTQFGTLNVSGAFQTGAVTMGHDGTVYLSKTKGSNSEVWKFSCLPGGALVKVCTITGSKHVQALAAHPSGYLYATDKHAWFRVDPASGEVEPLEGDTSDIEAMDFCYADEEQATLTEHVSITVTLADAPPDPTPVCRPDLLVAVLDGEYAGDGEYGDEAGSGLSIAATVKTKTSIEYFVKLQNDGTKQDTLRLQEVARSHSKWIVRYFDSPDGGQEITTAIQNGSWVVDLSPGEEKIILLMVVPGAQEKSVALTLRATPTGGDEGIDTVTITTTRPGSGRNGRLRILRWLER